MTLTTYLVENENKLKGLFRRHTYRNSSVDYQDAYQTQVLKSLSNTAVLEKVEKYAITCAYHQCADISKYYKRTLYDETVVEPPYEHCIDSIVLNSLIRKAQLSKREKQVLKLHLSGMDYDQMAVALDRDYETVKTTYRNIVNRLRDVLKDNDDLQAVS